MQIVTLRSLGGSVVLAVPKKILSLIDLHAGSRVSVAVESGRLVVDPQKKPKYTLAQLLARTRPSDFSVKSSDREWLSGGPAGKEAL